MTFSEHASAQEVPLGFQILQHLAFPLLSFFYVEFLWWTKNSVATATDAHYLQVVNRAITKIVYLAFWEIKMWVLKSSHHLCCHFVSLAPVKSDAIASTVMEAPERRKEKRIQKTHE